MNILQVNTDDVAGGAASVARGLQEGLRARGHRCWMAVGVRRSGEEDALTIDNDRYRSLWARGCIRTASLLDPLRGKFPGPGRLYTWIKLGLASPRRYWQIGEGKEDFDYPATARLLELPPARPDVLHLHNLHGGYFDLRALPSLSRKLPVFVTLHDPWLLGGHCAHPFLCERWKTGCGVCPDLTLYPAVRKDATAFNWQRKAEIYAASRLYLAAPSRWLMDRIEQSMLMPAVGEARVIPHGVDLSVFHPRDKGSLKRRLGIEPKRRVLLYAASDGPANPYKDFQTLRRAVDRAARSLESGNLLFIALGKEGQSEWIGNAEIRYVSFERSRKAMAAYYQAADLYLHAAKAETFCLAIAESMACGTAVVATRVGAIPELVADRETGLMVPPGDWEGMARAIVALLENDGQRRRLASRAAEVAKARFDRARMIEEYEKWYFEILRRRRQTTSAARPPPIGRRSQGFMGEGAERGLAGAEDR